MEKAIPQPKYRDQSGERGDSRDDSSLEAGEPLMAGGEHEFDRPWRRDAVDQKPQWQRVCASLRAWRWLLDTVLLLVIVILLLDKRWKSQKKYGQFEGSGDLTGFAPTFSQQITTFKPDFSYSPENATEFFSSEVMNKWVNLVPRGLGYVKMEHPEQYNNLPTKLKGYNDTVFTTSMTHQLHCLYAIMEEYQGKIAFPDKKPSDMAWHVNHCFEYLRQSIMCCGDTALEGTQTTFPEGWVGSDGWDAKHVCKDYGQVFKYLEDNRADNRHWI